MGDPSSGPEPATLPPRPRLRLTVCPPPSSTIVTSSLTAPRSFSSSSLAMSSSPVAKRSSFTTASPGSPAIPAMLTGRAAWCADPDDDGARMHAATVTSPFAPSAPPASSAMPVAITLTSKGIPDFTPVDVPVLTDPKTIPLFPPPETMPGRLLPRVDSLLRLVEFADYVPPHGVSRATQTVVTEMPGVRAIQTDLAALAAHLTSETQRFAQTVSVWRDRETAWADATCAAYTQSLAQIGQAAKARVAAAATVARQSQQRAALEQFRLRQQRLAQDRAQRRAAVIAAHHAERQAVHQVLTRTNVVLHALQAQIDDMDARLQHDALHRATGPAGTGLGTAAAAPGMYSDHRVVSEMLFGSGTVTPSEPVGDAVFSGRSSIAPPSSSMSVRGLGRDLAGPGMVGHARLSLARREGDRLSHADGSTRQDSSVSLASLSESAHGAAVPGTTGSATTTTTTSDDPVLHPAHFSRILPKHVETRWHIEPYVTYLTQCTVPWEDGTPVAAVYFPTLLAARRAELAQTTEAVAKDVEMLEKQLALRQAESDKLRTLMASNHGKAPDVDALHASAVASTLSRSPSTTAPPRTGVVVRAPTAGAGSVAPSSGRPSVVMNAGPRRSVVARIRESRAEAAAELTRMQHVREEEARVAQVAEMALLEARYTEYLRLIAVQFDEEAEHDTMMTARLDAVCAQAYQKALQRFDGDAGAAFRSRVRCNPVAGAQPRLAILDRLNSDLLRAHDHPGDR